MTWHWCPRSIDSASARDEITLRFNGVVGYHICFTRSRSSVRFRVEPVFFALVTACSCPAVFRLGLFAQSSGEFYNF